MIVADVLTVASVGTDLRSLQIMLKANQTLEQLAIKYGVSERTIRRDLEGMRYVQKIAGIRMLPYRWTRPIGAEALA